MAQILEPAPYRVQVIDRNGLVSPEWLKWLQQVRTLVTGTSAAADTNALASQLAAVQAALAKVDAEIAAAGPLTLKTNYALNGSQTLLNLLAGANVTLAENGAGEVMITALNGNAPVTSVAGRTGDIELEEADIANLTADLEAKAPADRLVIGFIAPGKPGTLGPALPAPHAGTLSQCVVTVTSSDPSVALAFTINQNGTSVFTAAPTVAAGAAAQSLVTFALSSASVAVAEKDLFTLDITAGSDAWQFTAQLT